MHASEIMARPVPTVGLHTPIADAIDMLTERALPALPVVDDDGRLIGLFSEADALYSEVTLAGDDTMTVESVMTKQVESASPNADVADVARLMLEYQLSCVPIVEGGMVFGLVTRSDLLRWPDRLAAPAVDTVPAR
ncbi:HPP family protein [Haloechinothrix salitolerans]|uniref:HPP family protein n=1 Tax=Haloechinothrix salitolerans TaxID=926830 RepID=A0ABW2BZS8_9PSEU